MRLADMTWRGAMLLYVVPTLAIAASDSSGPLANYISRVVPASANHMVQHRQGAFRPVRGIDAIAAVPTQSTATNGLGSWSLLATLPGVSVLHEISFVSTKVGYAAGEHGLVLKTVDGGKTWTSAMSIANADNYYWFGIQALSEQDLVVSGTYDAPVTDPPPQLFATLRWSHDGGVHWSDDIVLAITDWAFREHFFDSTRGVVLAAESPNYTIPSFVTSNGGAAAADWSLVLADPGEDWFLNQFSALANGHVRASGISYCESADIETAWTCRPSIDAVFDGETFFFDDNHGWVGGGDISPDVAGWLHRTDDGGQTWSDRTLSSPWPIREIRFATADIGWATGGNFFSGVGGIYRSDDGGQSWKLDMDTGTEMASCATVEYMTYCVGYDSSFAGYVYGVDWDHIFVDGMEGP